MVALMDITVIKMYSMKPYQNELLERLIKLSSDIIRMSKSNRYGNIDKVVLNQLTRSSLAPTLMYSEATAAESLDDFIHKMSLALKELRETKSCVRVMISISDSHDLIERWTKILEETDQLVAIFSRSVHTSIERKKSQHSKR